jgi:hypothetical protein
MTEFYDAGESFAVGDGDDRIDWTKLVKLRALIGQVADQGERRELVVELLRALYADTLEIR